MSEANSSSSIISSSHNIHNCLLSLSLYTHTAAAAASATSTASTFSTRKYSSDKPTNPAIAAGVISCFEEEELGRRPLRRGRIRKERKITPEYLDNVAQYYLQRHTATTAKSLQRVLIKRLHKYKSEKNDMEELKKVVDEIVARYVAEGFIDDAKYAEFRAKSMHERGDSSRKIQSVLTAKGIAQPSIDAAQQLILEEEEMSKMESEFVAACAYARKRGLGPYRSQHRKPSFKKPSAGGRMSMEEKSERFEQVRKDIATLARVGYPFVIAKRIAEAEDVDDLEQNGLYHE